ncbi:MAG: lytic murein transglycosylase [Beijerinckiaceae bacterium]|nr:MAG: lytic murein transglycosylase [Beijerinckiaceae bacterium]
MLKKFQRSFATVAAVLCVGVMLPASAWAEAKCRDPAGFDAWLGQIKQEAAAQGIPQSAIAAGLDGVTYDASVVSHDRGQRVFKQSFAQFSGRMINAYRLRKGAQLMRRYADVLGRIEQRFGVPGSVIVAIWGLETDFGAVTGKFPTIRAIATLAYDCRRSDMFKAELFDALKIVAKGDLSPARMHGAWAGEIGQTQFMPSTYLKFAIDFNGDGKADLIHDVPDVLASTANFLKSYGWKRGEGWQPGEPNFPVILQWNKANVYARTIALFAQKLQDKQGGR